MFELDKFIVDPGEAKTMPIRSEFRHFRVHYPYSMDFTFGLLKAKIVDDGIECSNADLSYAHTFEILWFNDHTSVPTIFFLGQELLREVEREVKHGH